MTNGEIHAWLMEHATDGYREFSEKLIKDSDPILGVRIPELRKLAKKLARGDFKTYLAHAADDSYEEIMLQGLVIGYAKTDIRERLGLAASFLPKIHDWSVTDSFCATFHAAAEYREEVWDFLMQYRESGREFEQRVVAVMLMDYFLVEEYIDRVLAVWESLTHEGYYCRMGVAWGIATAYAKFPKQTHAFLLHNSLDAFTYQKSIQKMLESYRISDKEKALLRTMKRKV